MSRRRRQRREFPSGELALAAMVDMMINVLIFLLTIYGTAPIEMETGPDLVLPKAASGDTIHRAVALSVSQSSVKVEGQEVLQLVGEGAGLRLPDDDAQLGAVRSALDAAVAGQTLPDEPPPDLSVQCDQTVPWEVLGPLLAMAGGAGVGEYRFVAYVEEQ